MTKPGNPTPTGQPPTTTNDILPLGGRAVADSYVDATPADIDFDAELDSPTITLAGSEVMNTIVIVYPRPTWGTVLLMTSLSLSAGALGTFAGRFFYDVFEKSSHHPTLVNWVGSVF